jgi:very-short-patch-repair endonuclease
MNLTELLRTHGPVLSLRDCPTTVANAVRWAARRRLLTGVLPGTYLPVAVADDPVWRARAAARWKPDAVVFGVAAAAATFWPELVPATVEVAAKTIVTRPGFSFSRRRIPPELTFRRGGMLLTTPALTALDLVPTHGGDPIDRVLRSRLATLEMLWTAFAITPGRPGNAARRTMLLDSRGEPWSAAERLAHRILRAAGIIGWLGNYRVTVRYGRTYFLDIAFPWLKLAIEIDGRFHQTDLGQFETDRWRQNDLVVDGWTVLRFTYRMLVEDPDAVIAIIRRAMRRCAA